MKYYVTVGYDRYERKHEISFSSYDFYTKRANDVTNGVLSCFTTINGTLSTRNDNVNYVHFHKSDKEESE